MKSCANCQTLVIASSAHETGYAACRLCGHTDFNDISETSLQELQPRNELCCPNPLCEPRLRPSDDNFCSKCAVPLKKATLDLWIQKCVEPFLEKNPEQLFSDISAFIEAARKMGFSSGPATTKFNDKIRQWTGGRSADVVVEWVSLVKNALDLLPPNDYININSSRTLYESFGAGDTAVGIILQSVQINAEKEPLKKTEVNFIEHIQGQYIGFHNKSNTKELWIYPIPHLNFSRHNLSSVFPELTAENYKIGNIMPRKARLVIGSDNSRIWSLTPSIENQLVFYLDTKAKENGINNEFTQKILKYFLRKL